ncbi:54S ribosomal protein img2, mitochondrial [Elasticomyces elasticus]|nr:54S ribosomal protein img2, mitochondrial [Elasticomyces elasticus]
MAIANSLQHSQRRNSAPVLPTQQSRTFLVQFRRQNQAQLSKETPAVRESVPSPAAANLQLTNLPYLIRRTPSNQYPVYLITKAGGTKQQTKVQKTEGDLDALRDDLAVYLGLEAGGSRAQKSPDISINRLNGHIIIKGWRKREILDFLAQRNF